MAGAPQDDNRAASGGSPLLEVSGLAYDYAGVGAVADSTLNVPKGRIVALIGGNGAGKTTSVKMIAGALRPKRGKVVFDGQDITGMPAHRVVELGLALVPAPQPVTGPRGKRAKGAPRAGAGKAGAAKGAAARGTAAEAPGGDEGVRVLMFSLDEVERARLVPEFGSRRAG